MKKEISKEDSKKSSKKEGQKNSNKKWKIAFFVLLTIFILLIILGLALIGGAFYFASSVFQGDGAQIGEILQSIVGEEPMDRGDASGESSESDAKTSRSIFNDALDIPEETYIDEESGVTVLDAVYECYDDPEIDSTAYVLIDDLESDDGMPFFKTQLGLDQKQQGEFYYSFDEALTLDVISTDFLSELDDFIVGLEVDPNEKLDDVVLSLKDIVAVMSMGE